MDMVLLHRSRGVTALELLVVVAVLALLASLATPSFASLQRAAALSAAANQLVWSLQQARSSAILQGVPTTLCLSADAVTCAGNQNGDARGWLVFQQQPGRAAGEINAGTPRLRSVRLPATVTVNASRAAVTYWPAARAGTTSTFDLCVSGVSLGRSVVVSQTGRPRVAAEAAACNR